MMQLFLAVLAAVVAQGTEPAMNNRAPMDEIIDSYQPAWMPPAGELKGLVVILDPLGGGAAAADDRIRDDLALKTGAHLYHLVRQAGGASVMTRADDRPLWTVEGGPRAALADICRQHKADIMLTIGFDRGKTVRAVPFADDPVSLALAEALAPASDKSPVNPRGELSVPGVAVWFSIPDDSTAAGRRGAFHRECAETLYKALAQAADRNREALRLAPRGPDDDTEPADADSVPHYPRPSLNRRLAAAARRVWPEGSLPVEKAAWFCDLYCRTNLSDRTIVYLKPEVRVDGQTVIVGGATNQAILRDTLADALKAAGIANVRNEMKLLPEEGRLGDRRFGVCVAPMALTFAEPSESAPLQTQVLYGEPLFLLDHDAARGYYLLHGADGYWGWVRADGVRAMTEAEFGPYAGATPAVLLKTVEAGEQRISCGATLPVARQSDSQVQLLRPDGGFVEVPLADVRILDTAAGAEQRMRSALEFLYVPYVFGALSSAGLDCSGLVRNVNAQAGIAVSRDAAQQVLAGRLVAPRWYPNGIRPGDYLFFLDRTGKIYHVGIAMTPTHFVHAAPPEVKINSLKEADRLFSKYRAESFLGAKRW